MSQFNRNNRPYTPRHQLLGHSSARVPPAWRTTSNHKSSMNGQGTASSERVVGSKIFLSRLPSDVGESEVEELFRKTVGPLTDSFLIYNNQGKSKGMAVVSFQRPGDAKIARDKYNNKIVDGRRPIKIEIVTDGDPPITASVVPTLPTSLLDRIASHTHIPTGPRQHATSAPRHMPPHKPPPNPQRNNGHNVAQHAFPIPPRRIRQKKGPKRVKKREAKSREQLDREMEDYRAGAETI